MQVVEWLMRPRPKPATWYEHVYMRIFAVGFVLLGIGILGAPVLDWFPLLRPIVDYVNRM